MANRVVKYVFLKRTARKYDTYFLPKVDVFFQSNYQSTKLKAHDQVSEFGS
jgi:hypothetical protein